MRYYRCKCGLHEAWGSMSPNPCHGCEECGSNLAENPGLHGPVLPHDWYESTVQTDEGPKTLTICSWCLIRKPPDALPLAIEKAA